MIFEIKIASIILFTVCNINSILSIYLCPYISGYYCEAVGLNDYTSFPCPIGHFCLAGTTSSTAYKCPGKYYLYNYVFLFPV